MITKIIYHFKQALCYLFLNLRRYINEKKLVKIHDNNLLNNGFIKFESSDGEELAKYLEEEIKDPDNCENSSKGKFKILQKSEQGVETIAVDASSEFIKKYVFTNKILEILKKFYGKKFYLRNNPTIEFSYDNKKKDSQKFHLDWGLKQVSLMINLNSLDKKSTHMEYLLKSNKQYKFKEPHRFSLTEIKKVENCLKKFEIQTTIGNTGQISIFDAGCGYHRQVSGKKRVMLHLNFTENLAFTYWNKKWSPSNTLYWFSDDQENLESKYFLFDLVKKKLKPGFFIPKVYNKNFIN